jgi:hypothetical protein
MRGTDRRPSVLIAATMDWPFPARIAMAFFELGWRVEAVCTNGDPMRKTRTVHRLHHYSGIRPHAALSAALHQASPDLVVPCDDRAVVHLQELHASLCASHDRGTAIATIARSLGDPRATAAVRGRAALITLAREEGLRAPPTCVVNNACDLRQAIERLGLPAMLKADDTWGGQGIVQVDTMHDAIRVFRQKARERGGLITLKRLLVDRDTFEVARWWRGASPILNAQAYVPGRPATSVLSCWNGEVLAAIHLKVLVSRSTFGSSAVVRVIDHPEMAEAATRIVGRLRMSGFCGLDFILEEETGTAHLIEMNQRTPQFAHLALGIGRDPVAALAAKLTGQHQPFRPPMTTCSTIVAMNAYGPCDAGGPEPADAYHDIPLAEPEFMREVRRLPWHERGWLARAIRRNWATRTRPTELVEWRGQ